ncbi:proliferation marker protein Ki-67 isoform X2 [Ursus arctos]|uniref:proliferation marker protein Ki-67 isoform X2 n=1 Tax=Ursus arctos TaxID=9644 RepID=UPI0025477785|nr:proliferation marker protein Ki-67 isoform X2 [Ursus arctos]
MGPTGRLVTIKRSGVDGPHFPLSLSTCLFGRGIECDIRIQLPVVSKQHCKIEISGQEAILFNFSSTNPTQVNGSVIAQPVHLKHGDVITIVDRSFRYENENHQNGSESTEFLGQQRKQESLHRVSRSSFSSDPDGKVEDSNARSKLSEENVSGSPLVHVKHGKAAGTVSDGPEDHTASKTLNGVRSSELPGENYRNAMDPTAGDLKEDSSGPLGSCNGELKSFPSTCCPENSENHQSPFRKLYESMKEEFDVKSEKGNVLPSGRKSGSRSHRTSENECSGGLQDGTQVLVSLKSRPRSGRFTPIKANPSLGEQGISQTEDRRKDEEAVETPKETMGPSIPPKEVTRTKTLVQHSPHNSSRKRRSEDVRVPSESESVSLDQREGFGTDNKTSIPRKFPTRNQTPTKVGNADNLEATPEKHFSRKGGSVPTSVDIPTTEPETQNHTVLAPLPVQVERKIQGVSGHQPEKVGAPAGHLGSGFPGCSSVDSGHSGDSINKIEGTPLKRRRVSFGGRLKPELFDENLPPNTPLKRGETPRRSLVSHTPPVLKKIIKEYPQPSRKEDSSEIRLEVTAQDQCKGSPAPNPTKTSPVANDTRRRSRKVSAVSSGSKSPHHTDIPKRGARKSGNLPSKRTSIDRSQHEILQRIYSKRRSGASEANLIVAKSWADVVKLGAKQTQAKVVKHGPQRQLSKRHRRANTPKKPVSDVHNQFSTGHANSPCTIIIGKAHTEKVHVPARPYRMLNNFVFSKKMDFNEDLSGLTEMFKTPAKMKPQAMSLCPNAFSKSEDFLGKKPEVPNSGEKPLLCTSENFGETIFPMTQNAPQEPSDQSPVSSALRRPAIRVNLDVEKAPGSEAEPPKAASSADKFRRSVELRGTQTPGPGPRAEEANTDTAENTSGQRLRKTPQRRQKPEGATEEWESCFEACEKPVKSEDSSEKMVDMRRSRRYSEQKWKPIADLSTLKRQQDTEPKEDLGGIQGLSLTPSHTQELMDVGNKTAEKCQKSSKPESVGMPTRMNIQLKTSPQKVDLEEEPSSLRKPTRTLGENIPSHREPGDGDEDMKWFNRTPKQNMDSAENVTGSKRQSRTPKRNVQSLEDLAGLRELFQTPNHTDKPRTDGKTSKVPCKSPLADPVNTPTSRKWQLETLPQKVDLEEAPSALRKPTQTPRTAMLSYREPGGDDEDIKLFKETPKQKLNPAENITGSRRRPRTPKKMVHSLEDLVGLKELFQTPGHTQDPVTDNKTTKAPCKSPVAEPVNTPTSRRRQLKTAAQKVDIEEEPSALRKPIRTAGESGPLYGEPEGGNEDIKLFNRTPKQKVDFAENVTGSKRRSRTPRRNVQSLEDLAGLRELFQTPNHTDKPMVDDKTTKVPCKSPLAKPVNTPTSRRRQLGTPGQKVDLEEDLRKAMQTLGESTYTHREPGGGDEDIRLFKDTPKQKMNPADNVTGSKRQSRTPKKNAQSLEDLAGLRELFQTPEHTQDPMTDDKTTKVPCKSPLAEPVNTLTSRRRQLETSRQKVDLQEEPSALRKSTQMPGESIPSHREPGNGDEDTKWFNRTPKQSMDSAENVTGSKRQSRTPKRNAQSLEDLAGLRELFQTPEHTQNPMTDDKTTKVPCKSPLAEPVNTSSRRRQLETPGQTVDVEEEPSALRNPTQTPEESTHSHREPGGGDEDIRLFKAIPKQKLDAAENVTGSKRRSRTPKKNAQSLEHLAGLRELFQTPNHTDKPTADDKTTKVPCKSPLAEPVNAPSRKRQLETPLQKVDLEEDPLALRKPTRTPRKTTPSCREPGGDDEDIHLFKETPEKKLDHVENVTGSKKWIRAVMPCKSPLAEAVNTPTHMKRCLKIPLGKVDLEKELSPLGKPTQTPREATHTYTEPGGGDEAIRQFKETPKQKLNPAENVTGSKRRPRAPKKMVHSLEDLVGLKELFQTPGHTQDLVTDNKTTKVPCKSPLAEPVSKPMSRRRRLKPSPQQADAALEPSALRKSTRTRRGNTESLRQPGGADEDNKLLNKTAKQKLDSAENVTGSKRQSRTAKKNAQSLEDVAGLRELLQTPEHTQDLVTEDKTTKVPCTSPLAEPVNKPTSRRRRLKPSPQQADAAEEPSALRKSTRMRGRNTQSHREPGGADEDITSLNETSKQKLSPAENITLRKNRLRAPKEEAQPPEDLARLKELSPGPDRSKEPGKDSGSIEGAPEQTPDRRKPVEVLRRGLRAPRVIAVEDLGAHREPVESGSEGGVSLPSKRKRGTEGSSTGTKRLCSATPAQGAAEEKPPQKRRRTTPTEECGPPEPLTVKKRMRVVAERMELLGDPPRSHRETKARGREAERTTPPHQGMSLRSRRPNKTEVEEERPEPVITAGEKPKTKTSDKKPLMTSEETMLQTPEDGAKNLTSGGKAPESRMRLRSTRPSKTPSPDVAEGKQREKRVGVHRKKQEEEVKQASDPVRLRSRKITVPPAGNTLEGEPQQRVTRSAKRSAENIKKDNDNVCIKKLRTRSRRDNEDI